MRRRAFTVVELMVAVVMLTAIIVATGKIFSTASKVASSGEATADVLQQGTILQEQMKRDIVKICRDGYFAIQCVAVRNDAARIRVSGCVSSSSSTSARSASSASWISRSQ